MVAAKQEVEKRITLETRTPSGIEIAYEAEPKRLYRIRRQGEEEWREVISVTTALDALNKSGLPWWGMTTGVQGVLTLYERGFLLPSPHRGQMFAMGDTEWEYATSENVTRLLTKQKLTVNHIRDAAGDRGHSVHEALEAWMEDGTVPVPEFYPETEQGYVRGLVEFLGDLGELKSKPLSEVMVGSHEYGFAGRYDSEVVLHGANLRVKLATPAGRKPEQRAVFSGRTLFDLKTPKGVYPSHHIQLALYEGARRECGYPKTEQQLVIRVTPDGTYEAVPSRATYDDGLAVLAVARAVERIEKG